MLLQNALPANNVTEFTTWEKVQSFGWLLARTGQLFKRGESDQISPDMPLFQRFTEELSSQYRRRESSRADGKLEPERLVVVLISQHEP